MKEAMMESTPLFSVLTEAQRSIIAGRMSTETRRAGDLIYQQGRPATALYLIKSGWARLVTDQFAVLANLGAGSLLGEADTISGRNYATSSEAATDVTLWVLAANDLKAIMADYPDIGRAIKRAMGLGEEQAVLRHLRRLELLGGLSQDQLQEVAEHLQPARFTAGETIYRRGSEGDALYLVDQGQVQVATAAGAVNSIGAGETFGEGAFLTGETHSTEVRAQTDVVTWSLTRTDFESLAMRYPILALNLSRSVSRRLRERNMRPAASAQVAQPAPVIQRAPVAASTAVTVNKAADTATSWWGARSRGAKFRLIAMILLLIWLLGVAAPAIIISLLSRAPDVNASRSMARSYTTVADSAVLVALAADLPEETNPTYTPWPTETPIPTPTFTPTATPTETPLPTETPIPPTETPVPPTATPIPPTRTVVRQVVQQVAAQPALAAAVAPKAAPAPAPASTQYSVIELRRLEPCENRGNHHIFVTVVDGAGNPVDGVTLVQSPVGEIGNVLDKSVSGAKGPGKAEFVMWKHGEYAVYPTDDGANPGNTEVARSMNPNFVDEANCADGGGGNTLFHNSFAVTFRKNF